MLYLPDVTLVFVAGNYTAVSLAALRDIRSKFHFERELIFTNAPLEGEAATVIRPLTSIAEATVLSWRIVPAFVQTYHALFAQWDGYPVEPNSWCEGFRAFDFIGAVWPWMKEHSVGNTGFSLQSKALLDALTRLPLKHPEDVAIAREYRPKLEDWGIRFADVGTANRFSIEHMPLTDRLAFGFHGVWNFLNFMSDEEVKERLSLMEPRQWRNHSLDALIHLALKTKRNDLAQWVCNNRQKQKEAA